MAKKAVPDGPAARIERYLKESGWGIVHFAEVCDLDKGHAWRFVHRKQAVSMASAVKIAARTRAAKDGGLTEAAPILAGELCEALLTLTANDTNAERVERSSRKAG